MSIETTMPYKYPDEKPPYKDRVVSSRTRRRRNRMGSLRHLFRYILQCDRVGLSIPRQRAGIERKIQKN